MSKVSSIFVGVFKGIVFWARQCNWYVQTGDTHQPPFKVLVVSLRRLQKTLIEIYAMVVLFEPDEKLRYCKILAG